MKDRFVTIFRFLINEFAKPRNGFLGTITGVFGDEKASLFLSIFSNGSKFCDPFIK